MRVYLDTNIIRDYLEARNADSTGLIDFITDKKYDCVTSNFSMMELSDIQKDTLFFRKKVVDEKWNVDQFLRRRGSKDLNKDDFNEISLYLNDTRTKLPSLQFINLGEDGWKIAEYIASNSNLSAVDIIHLVTAYTFGCNILATRDEQFIREGNKILEISKRRGDIKLCLPAKTLELIK